MGYYNESRFLTEEADFSWMEEVELENGDVEEVQKSASISFNVEIWEEGSSFDGWQKNVSIEIQNVEGDELPSEEEEKFIESMEEEYSDY